MKVREKSVIMIWNSTFLRITKSNCNELWFPMTVCRHNNFFHITDSEILLLSVWMQKYINLFKDSILWLIIVLSFSLDRLESSVTNSHFFHWWSLKSCVEVEQCVIIYIYYYNNNLIQRVRSFQTHCHCPDTDYQIKPESLHLIWSDDWSLVTLILKNIY